MGTERRGDTDNRKGVSSQVVNSHVSITITVFIYQEIQANTKRDTQRQTVLQ